MTGQFELYCEYMHCCGKKRLELGRVENECTAKQWCREQTRMGKRPRLPKTDLIRTCPVVHCPAKLQVPVYGYRDIGI